MNMPRSQGKLLLKARSWGGDCCPRRCVVVPGASLVTVGSNSLANESMGFLVAICFAVVVLAYYFIVLAAIIWLPEWLAAVGLGLRS